ncbi:MAG: hypothetical protein R3C45_13855 [Phycisphaerales bacterium]
MLEYFFASFTPGDEDSLVEAVRFCDRLITGLGSVPYPKEVGRPDATPADQRPASTRAPPKSPPRPPTRMTDPDLGGPITKLVSSNGWNMHSR